MFFLTGTDEHGQKVEKAATERGLSPKEHVDRIVGRFADLWKALDISNDGFIRTTDPGHERGVQKVFQLLRDKGDIYKGTYQGWYCVSDENFIADDVADRSRKATRRARTAERPAPSSRRSAISSGSRPTRTGCSSSTRPIRISSGPRAG